MALSHFWHGKVVVITGGSSGLGLEIARRLASPEVTLVLVARKAAGLAEAAREIGSLLPGAAIQTVPADVGEEGAISTALAGIAKKHGRVDVVFHSAGILREGPFAGFDAGVFREVMETNFYGAVNVARAALPHLQASRGALVNIASAAGLTAAYGYSAYCASKHALVGFSEVLRFEQEPHGVRVHLVCPAEFDSPMVDAIEATRSPENRAHTLTIPKQSVAVIAAETIAGVERGDFLIVPGRSTRMALTAARLFPGLSRKVGDWRIRRARK